MILKYDKTYGLYYKITILSSIFDVGLICYILSVLQSASLLSDVQQLVQQNIKGWFHHLGLS